MRLNTKWYEKGDRLTTRERKLYVWLSAVGVILTLGYVLGSSFFGPSEVTVWSVIFTCFLAFFAAVFGAALKNDVRVIHGVKWLREGETKHGPESNSRSD